MSDFDLKLKTEQLLVRLEAIKGFLKISKKIETIIQIEKEMEQTEFWQNIKNSKIKQVELASLKKIVEKYEKLYITCQEQIDLLELAEDDNEYFEEIKKDLLDLEIKIEAFETLTFLNNKFDKNSAYFSIHAGAGGTEACDWTKILLRMYTRYFKSQGWSYSIMDYNANEPEGIKSVSLLVEGDFVYGYMKCEKGVHRLVRISPFDSNANRHTSFSAVDVFPKITENIEIEVKEEDIRVDTFRASGNGGQGVNTTDSAVRITHLPSGIVVGCQKTRSQTQNKNRAMIVLKSKLYFLNKEKNKKEISDTTGEKQENTWSNHIRSYTMQPYQLVKDVRTKIENNQIDAVLNGDLEKFIFGFLKFSKQ